MASLRSLLLASALASVAAKALFAEGTTCSAVTRDQCGTTWQTSCLECGSSSNFDCEKCCPGCKQVAKSSAKYCECSGPAPSPSPGPSPGPSPTPSGGDSWQHYEVAGLTVESVTGGSSPTNYEKAVIMLHGGGETGTMWENQYNSGWFGDLTGIKYVFPTSALYQVWFNTYKVSGCGLMDDCSYDIPSIEESATRVAALINHEKSLLGGDGKKVFIAGFSEGAQLTGYMQIAKMDFALGGVIIMDGFPLPPLTHMPNHPEGAKANATYYGSDMRWMIWQGAEDTIFPPTETINTWNGIFTALGASDTVKIEHTEPGLQHWMKQSEFTQMVSFIRGESEMVEEVAAQDAHA